MYEINVVLNNTRHRAEICMWCIKNIQGWSEKNNRKIHYIINNTRRLSIYSHASIELLSLDVKKNEYTHPATYIFYFKNKDDALKFKLRWK